MKRTATTAGVARGGCRLTKRERKRYWEPWRRAVSFKWAKDKMTFATGKGWSIADDKHGGTHEQG